MTAELFIQPGFVNRSKLLDVTLPFQRVLLVSPIRTVPCSHCMFLTPSYVEQRSKAEGIVVGLVEKK